MSMILNPYRYAAAGPTFGNASREFDGVSDIITIADDATLDITSAISICFWVKFLGAGGNNRRLVQKSPANAAYLIFATNSTNNPVAFRLQTSGGRKTLNGSTLNDGNWRHVVGTYDGTTMKIYVDDNLDASTTFTETIATTSGNLCIGGDDSLNENLYGRMADVRIYSRAISAAEVSDLFSGTDIDDTGLVGWFLTDSDDVLDYSGNGNDGTNNGSTYSTDGPFD